MPASEVIGKGDYFRFSLRDSLALEASFVQVSYISLRIFHFAFEVRFGAQSGLLINWVVVSINYQTNF